MKRKKLPAFLMLLFFTIACADKNKTGDSDTVTDSTIYTKTATTDAPESGKIIQVTCDADPSQSYAAYLPVKGNKEALPVIYFFDPHGDGSYPLGKYKGLADIYNCILIGSNNSKNGNAFPATENIWNTLLADTKKRLHLNVSRIYACGFSGGAKAATYIALTHHEIKGVIANGAGLPEMDKAGSLPFSFTAIAGQGDMNMTDLVAITNGLDTTQTRHRIIFFDGIHEWAPASTMDIAFAALQLDAMYEKLTPVDDSFIHNFIAKEKKAITTYANAGDKIKAEANCKLSISMLDGLTKDVDWFKEEDISLKQDPAYKKENQLQQDLLVKEQNIKAAYSQQLEQGDMKYWTATIQEVQARAKAATAEGAMYKRLNAFLSLAFYSISNQLINASEDKQAEYFVELYKMADATNSEAWYFSAILHARNNNADATQADLLKAVMLGFNDKNRLLQQEEFKKMGSQINIESILNSMK